MRPDERPTIVIAGASGHAKVVIDVVEREGAYSIVGLIDTFVARDVDFHGYRVLGTERDLPAIIERHQLAGFLVAIGDNWIRSQFADRVAQIAPELRPITAVHPSAQLARGVNVGPGTVIMAGAVINSDSHVGAHCIVNTRASIDHDNRLEDFSSVAPGATLGGTVRLGAYAAVGLGASVIHGRKIGRHAVIGAGAIVLSDVQESVVSYGCPARNVRERNPGDPYL
jgi:sugar O-acyltransferase (sialic acid O-acetyltransferase NeuD family)